MKENGGACGDRYVGEAMICWESMVLVEKE
jgi:hypothetical protein